MMPLLLSLMTTLFQGCCIPFPSGTDGEELTDLPSTTSTTDDPVEPSTTDESSTTDLTTEVASGDSGATGPFFGATRFTMYGEFGFDGTAQFTVDDDGTPVEPIVFIVLARPGWITNNFGDLDNYCQFIFPMASATFRAEVSTDSRLWWAMDWNSAQDPVINTCSQRGLRLDPKLWSDEVLRGGGPDITDGMLTSDHFVGLGERTAAIDADLKGAGKAFEETVGAVLSTPFAPFSVGPTVFDQIDDAYAFAFEIDGSGNLVRDADGLLVDIPRADVFDGTNVARGFYLVRAEGWRWL